MLWITEKGFSKALILNRRSQGFSLSAPAPLRRAGVALLAQRGLLFTE